MEPIYDSYCGLFCGACSVLVANEEGEVEKRAAEWNKKPEELRCFGCKTTTVLNADCGMRLCARGKEIDSCHKCDEYPCAMLESFRADEHPHHSVVLKNLETIKGMGLNAWLLEQKKRWSCPGCGARFTWYDEVCRKCGVKLYNCRDEEADL